MNDHNYWAKHQAKQIAAMQMQGVRNNRITRKPLTDEQITQICMGLWSGGWREKAMQDFARAIERAHGITE